MRGRVRPAAAVSNRSARPLHFAPGSDGARCQGVEQLGDAHAVHLAPVAGSSLAAVDGSPWFASSDDVLEGHVVVAVMPGGHRSAGL